MKHKILKFTLLTYALIWAAAELFRLSGGKYASIAGTILGSICMLIPLMAVLIMQAMEGEPILKGLGISWKINRWWIVGWLLMPIADTIIVGVCALLPSMSFNAHTDIVNQALAQINAQGMPIGSGGLYAIELLSGLIAGCTINALFAFGEEVGWRGYLLKLFEGKHFLFACLMTSLIWGLWHAPLILMGHNYPDHPVIGVFMMVGFCLSFTPVITYIRLKSGSVIAAAIVHGSLNALAGLSLMYIDNYHDLLGVEGLAGILVFLAIDVILFLIDRFVTKDRIFSSAVNCH